MTANIINANDGAGIRPGVTLFRDDCLEALRRLPSASVHAIVTDPPAGINFMGKDWDKDKGGRDLWIAWMTEIAVECRRVLVPGGHALVWALPRTAHWTAMAWENAGFETRDRIAHIFGSGFPKSHNISKAMDKAAGANRKVVGKHAGRAGKPRADFRGGHLMGGAGPSIDLSEVTEPATPEAKQWEGWGTALKPAVEDWYLFRNPISEATIVKNVLKYGTGALNIQATAIPAANGEVLKINHIESWSGFGQMERPDYEQMDDDLGRWPANLVHDGSRCVVEQFPITSSGGPGKVGKNRTQGATFGKEHREPGTPLRVHGDAGSAARFYNELPPDPISEGRAIHRARLVYFAKPTKAEKNYGVDGPAQDPAAFEHRPTKKTNPEKWKNIDSPHGRVSKRKNNHPTVKRKALMVWLIRLITPPGGTVLDAFMGSGTTGVAATETGHPFIGIEKDQNSFYISVSRIMAAQAPLFPDDQPAVIDQEESNER